GCTTQRSTTARSMCRSCACAARSRSIQRILSSSSPSAARGMSSPPTSRRCVNAARMTGSILTYRGAVYPWHCDHMGHMNVMWYVGKCDEATWPLFARVGLQPGFLRENGRGMAAVEQTIQYKRELLAGDLVTIRSSVLELKEKSIRFLHEMRKDGLDE